MNPEHAKQVTADESAERDLAEKGMETATATAEESKSQTDYAKKFPEAIPPNILSNIKGYSENGTSAANVPAIAELLKQAEALSPENVGSEGAQKFTELTQLGEKLKAVDAFIREYKALAHALDNPDIKLKPKYAAWKAEFDGISIQNYSPGLGQQLKALKEKVQPTTETGAEQPQEGATAAPEEQAELLKLTFENQNCSLYVDSRIWGSLNALPGRARMRVYEELKKVWAARNKTDTTGKDEATMQGLAKVNSYVKAFVSLNDRYRALSNNLMRIDDPKFAEEIQRTLSANFDGKEGVILDFKTLPESGDIMDYFKSASAILKDVEKKTVEKMGTWGSWLASIENKFFASKGVADLVKTIATWIFGKEALEALQSMFPGTFGKPESEKVKETIKDLEDKISSLPETDPKKKEFLDRLKKVKEGKIGEGEGEYKDEKARTDDLEKLKSDLDTYLTKLETDTNQELQGKITTGDGLIRTMGEMNLDKKQENKKDEFKALQNKIPELKKEWDDAKAKTDTDSKEKATEIGSILARLQKNHDDMKPFTAKEETAKPEEAGEIEDREHYEKAVSEFFQVVMDQLENEDRPRLRKMTIGKFFSLDTEEKMEEEVLEEKGWSGLASLTDSDVEQVQSFQKVLKKFSESNEGKALQDKKGENIEDYFVRMFSTEKAASKFYDIITNDDYKFDKEKIKKIYDDNGLPYRGKQKVA